MQAPAHEVARRILASYFPRADARPAGRSIFDLADFQLEGVLAARRMLDRWGGVVVADSVGLGKTYVGLALLEDAMRDGCEGIVVVPAALRRTWRPGLQRLQHATGQRVPLMSHTQLARGRLPEGLLRQEHARRKEGLCPPERPERRLVVVDEAHAFRNRRTHRYPALARLCRDARVVLITATPVNNSVMDLYALIRLFARDDAFRELGVPALRAAFRTAAKGRGRGEDCALRQRRDGRGTSRAPPAEPFRMDPILPVVQAVVIRRTRALVRDRYGEVRIPRADDGAGAGTVLTFPRRASPDPVPYSLFEHPETFALAADDLLAVRFTALGTSFNGIRTGRDDVPARRGPAATRDGSPAGTGMAELMRLALLKRLESGLHPFRLSVERQLAFHEAFLDALGRGFLLPARLHRALAGDGDALQLLLEPLALERLPPHLDREQVAADVRADIAHLRALRDHAGTPRHDAKHAALLALIQGLPGRKLVVFTEFRDTAAYVWRRLLAAGIRTGRVDGAGAFLGRERAGRRVVIDRFAPRSNGARPPPLHERVDVLVATDVLAEGLNLQDAAHVVSYDLPWNPVRLIQRVGRIDRLGSPHDVVYPHFLLPGPDLERLLGLHARIRAKLSAIGATVGLDGTVLDDDDGTSVVARLARGDPDVLDELERADAARLEGRRTAMIDGPDEDEGRTSGGMPAPDISLGPPAAGVGYAEVSRIASEEAGRAAYAASPSRLSLVALDVDGTSLCLVVEGGHARLDDHAAARILRGVLDAGEPVAESSHGGMESVAPAELAAVLEAALREVRRRRDVARVPPPQDPRSPAARAARWLRSRLARETTRRLEPGLVDQVDGVLKRLARPVDAATEARIEDVLRLLAGNSRRPPPGPGVKELLRAVSLLEDATEACAAESPGPARSRGERPRIRWIGALIGSDARP